MASNQPDIIHHIGGKKYGTWTIPKDQIRKAYKAERGYEIDDETLDEMSSERYYSYYKPGEEEVTVKRVVGDTYVGKLYTNTTASPAPFRVDQNAGGKVKIENAIFSDMKGQTTLKDQTATAAKKDIMDGGGDIDKKGNRRPDEPVSEEEAEKEVNDALNNNFADKNADEEKTGTQDLVNLETMVGTRKKFDKNLAYPTGIEKNGQDTLKIQMMEYRARDLQSSQGALGPEKRATGNIIGSVILPIPGNIKDSDKVEWGDDSMNAGQLAAAAFGAEFIKGGGAAGDELRSVLKGLKSLNPENAQDAISTMMAGAAIGKDPGKLMSRATGQVMNPNMELLFNGPSLRNFSFTFLLAPRSKDEAKNVIKIIRFFKQGMAAIRSKSNLFLKAPHTFQLKYNYRGKDEHPYLNSFKECALKSCDVNYTPENSYSTYEDGVMTAYSLTLAFSELEPIYNDDYGQENAEHLNFSATYDRGDGTIGKTETTSDGRTVQTTIDPIHGHKITTHSNKPTTIYDSDGNFTKEYLMSQTGGSSDIRLKENIIKVNQSPSGLNIYEWNYKSEPNSRYRGVMAQEVMKIVPEAVYAEEDGFLSVYYNLIDVNMELV